MPFTPDDTYTALKYLSLPPRSEIISHISTALNNLQTQSADLVTEVQTIFSQIAAVQATFIQETGSVNFALKGADVLSYEQKQRTVGMLMQQLMLVQRLGELVGMHPNTYAIEHALRMLDVKRVSPPRFSLRILRD